MGRLRRNRVVGIAALGDTLKNHWGAVGRDLVVCGFTWDDIGSERLPVGQFASFVAWAPPGTALFHARNKGWLPTDYLLADVVDAVTALVWMGTEDARRKFPQHRPEPIFRPNMVIKKPPTAEHHHMTAAEYAEKAGIQVNWGDDETA